MAILSAFFAGITAILAKIGMHNVDSDIATALRTVVILFFSWGIVYSTGVFYEVSDVDTNSLIFLILSGVATGLSWLCYFKALSIGNVNKVVAIDKLSIVLTVLLAIILFDEINFLMVKIICIIMISAGLLMMIEKQKALQAAKSISYSWLCYAVLSAVFATLTAILGKYGINGVDSNLGTAIRVCVILVVSWLMVLYKGKLHCLKNIECKEAVFIFLSAITTGLSWLCYYYSLQNGVVSIVAAIDKMSILVSIIFSFIVFKEKLTRKAFCGLSLIVIGTLAMTVWH